MDSYRFLDFISRQVIRAWVERERPRAIPWTPLRKPLAQSTIAIVSSAGVALNSDAPFDQERERRNPWWGDPSFRVIPHGTTAAEVRLCHMHIDTRFGEEDIDVVLPTHRLDELVRDGIVGGAARSHYSVMGYILRPREFEDVTAPAIASRMNGEGVDAAVLVPS
jgi:D-proline reductase (dithiol) PrdB